MRPPVYLDHAATTPVAPEVLAAMLPYFSAQFGNPSSIHRWGQQAEHAMYAARQQLAAGLNCSPDEIFFTGGGSESDNLALRGAALAAQAAGRGRHLITTAVEHHAVLHTAQQLRDHFDFDLTLLAVDAHACVSAQQLADAIRPDTVLVSLMLANNEVGSLQPVAELAAVARAHGVLFHTDAVQAASQLELDVQALGVDLLSLGAHKFYGPTGVGALYVRRGTQMLAVQTGGSQEHGLRAGTQNVPLIAGMAAALQLVLQRRAPDNAHFGQLRDSLIAGVLQRVPESRLSGHPQQRLPNHASFVFREVDGNALLMRLDLEGVAASSGSACKTGDPRPSSVLLAMGAQPDWARGSLRLSVGRATTAADVDYAVQTVERCVAALRK